MPCRPSQTCTHNRRKQFCVECGGGSLCPCRRRKNLCKVHQGSSICEHNRVRESCQLCSPNTHLWRRIRQATRRVSKCAGGIKTEHSRKIVGCSPEEFNEYWERKVQAWARERGMKSVEGVVFVIDHIKVFIYYQPRHPPGVCI